MKGKRQGMDRKIEGKHPKSAHFFWQNEKDLQDLDLGNAFKVISF